MTASLVLFFDPDPEATLRGWLELLRPGTGRLGLTTFGAIDEHWAAAEAALLAHAPAGVLDPRTTGTRGPFASSEALESLVRAVRSEPGRRRRSNHSSSRCRTPQRGARGRWASGCARSGRACPRAPCPSVLAEVEAALEGDRGDDGQLHLTQQVRYTTARVA